MRRSTRVKTRRCRPFRILPRHPGVGTDPVPFRPLELELREKNERVARRETRVHTLKVLGQPVTSEVSSSAEK